MIKKRYFGLASLLLVFSCTLEMDPNGKGNPMRPAETGSVKRNWYYRCTPWKSPENRFRSAELEIRGAQSEDDGQESVSSGSVNTSFNYIELRVDLGRWGGAYRFPDVQIPQGATINSAFISLVNYVETFRHAVDSVGCEDVDSAAVLIGGYGSHDISSRWDRRTDAAVLWHDTIKGGTGVRDSTPDLKALVQEIVDRPNWKKGNAIIFLFKCLSLESDTSHLELYTWDLDDHTYGGILHVSYGLHEPLITKK